MLKKIAFEIETVTPMFLSGADQNNIELRPQSVKGRGTGLGWRKER